MSQSDILNNTGIDTRIEIIKNKLWINIDVLKSSNIPSRIPLKAVIDQLISSIKTLSINL